MRYALVLPLAVVVVLATTACRSSSSSSSSPDASSSSSSLSRQQSNIADTTAPPACTDPTVIRTRVEGRFEGRPSDGFVEPRLVVAIDYHGSTPPDGVVAELPLAAPRFAAEYTIGDLCVDDGSTVDRIAVRCVTGGEIGHLVVSRNADGLAVAQGTKTTLWKPSNHDSRCFELHGLERPPAQTSPGAPQPRTVDIETLRRTWELDAPKCPRVDTIAPVKLTMKLDAIKGSNAHRCSPEGPAVDSARTTLLGAGAPKDLGTITNLCGGSRVTRWEGLNGIEVEASDMGTVKRFAYQLGDRVYYVLEDGSVHAAELPCGARAVFGVLAPSHPAMRERPDFR